MRPARRIGCAPIQVKDRIDNNSDFRDLDANVCATNTSDEQIRRQGGNEDVNDIGFDADAQATGSVLAQRELSLREKAKQLGVCEETVRRHARELGGRKIGKLWRFPYDDRRLALRPSATSGNGEQLCQSQQEELSPLGRLKQDSATQSTRSQQSTDSTSGGDSGGPGSRESATPRRRGSSRMPWNL